MQWNHTIQFEAMVVVIYMQNHFVGWLTQAHAFLAYSLFGVCMLATGCPILTRDGAVGLCDPGSIQQLELSRLGISFELRNIIKEHLFSSTHSANAANAGMCEKASL